MFLIRRLMWLAMSVLSFVLSVVGLALPLIPQVPFILLFLYSLSKFSPRFHRWLSNTRLYHRIRSLLDGETQFRFPNVFRAKSRD